MTENTTRYIFVIGGVMSGIGKGVATASLGKLLSSRGYTVTAIKIDPYLNVDAGTMNPLEHGEVFVTKDGVECDQDMGNYERFLNTDLTTHNYLTSGRVYQSVIQRERNLEYGGRCVEIVPDIPDEVTSRIEGAAHQTGADFVLVEIGGTVGEYQNMLFLEAARMMHLATPDRVQFVLVSYLPVPNTIHEMKTKPTQTASRMLNEAGIQPDIILARSTVSIDEPRRRKISTFCNVRAEDVISSPDVDNIYEVPLNYEAEQLADKVLTKFGMDPHSRDLSDWRAFVEKARSADKTVKIGVVGKYFETGDFALMDSYISVIEAVKHAAWWNGAVPEITWLSAQQYEQEPDSIAELNDVDGVIVPGGFGKRGTEGKIAAIRYCRENNIPYFGLCLGLQLAVIEFARSQCGITEATSREFLAERGEGTCVIDVMPEQEALLEEQRYGGTMRLGEYECRLAAETKAHAAYAEQIERGDTKKPLDIHERHRHRYEVANEYRDALTESGLVVSGVHPQRDLVEVVELPGHPFFVGTQFHPEFTSRPLTAHPLYYEFIRAALS